LVDRALAPGLNQDQMPAEAVINSVDVIVAAWNRASTIERAVLSALAQPEVRSVIVIDDCSTDDTTTRAFRIAAEHVKRVTVVALSANGGPAAARNFGLKVSTAPWIGILDADDFFLPGRLGNLLAEATECDFIADNILQVKQGQEKERQVALLEGMDVARNLDFETFVLGNVSQWGSLRKELGFLKPLMRRSFLSRHGLRYNETLRLGEDYALYAHALALRARFRVLPNCGYVSVDRPDSLSSCHTMQDLERLRDFDFVLREINGITTREQRAIRRHYNSVDGRAQWGALVDAVKARSIPRSVAPFFCSPSVSYFLLRNLGAQIGLRSGRSLSRLMPFRSRPLC
jgi:succinoglycan biosynthesis protein ExoU